MAREQGNEGSGLPAVRGEVLPARVWHEGDEGPLPPLPESVYPPEAVPLEPAPPPSSPGVTIIVHHWTEGGQPPAEGEPEYDEPITGRELRNAAVLAALVFGVFVFSPLGWVGGLILAVFAVVVYLAA